MARKDDDEVNDYVADKLQERAYPGLGLGPKITGRVGVLGPATSQAVEMANKATEAGMYAMAAVADTQGRHICDMCGKPQNPALPHNCLDDAPVPDITRALDLTHEPAVWVDVTSETSATYEFQNIPNEQATRIVREILPKALELYLKKSKDYGGNVMDRFDLGQKAAIPDMARKFGKLIDAIWRDQPLQFEQPEEILMDLLGHILIILDQREQGK
jgi:hypothetical protein